MQLHHNQALDCESWPAVAKVPSWYDIASADHELQIALWNYVQIVLLFCAARWRECAYLMHLERTLWLGCGC